jgi:phage/conjugal plasmid C-4 type zinc finger TraR family protein
MTDIFDRASEQEARNLSHALAQQARRAGLSGKTEQDSAKICAECGDEIPAARRTAVPGCRHCVECQARLTNDFYQRT